MAIIEITKNSLLKIGDIITLKNKATVKLTGITELPCTTPICYLTGVVQTGAEVDTNAVFKGEAFHLPQSVKRPPR